MSYLRTKGSTNRTVYVYLINSSTWLPKTGLSAASVSVYYIRTRGAPTSVPLSALADVEDPHTDGGWIEIPNMDGWYRLDLPDACFATGADDVSISVTASVTVMVAPMVIYLDFDHPAGVDDIIDQITDLAQTVPTTSFIDSKHTTTINQIRGQYSRTITEAFDEAELARKCVGNTRQITQAGVETIMDDDGATPIRQITRSEPQTGILREEATDLT